MKRKPNWRSAMFGVRAAIGFILCLLGVALSVLAIGVSEGQSTQTQIQSQLEVPSDRKPLERTAVRAAHSFQGDLRTLPYISSAKEERPELEPPPFLPRFYQLAGTSKPVVSATPANITAAPAPAPALTFDGLDYATWGGGHPPDPNGDAGPNYYIQVVNTSIGIYRKTDGLRVAAFTFNTFMSQGHFGNLCDTNNFGDPVVLYDSFEDRWIITDFAFKHVQMGNILNPPGVYQCFAASKTGDPVNGGWNYYSIFVDGGLDDYPKFGIWSDGLYMSANIYDYSSSYKNPRVWAFNKAQMYTGASTMQVLTFDAPSSDFTLLPSDARLQTGTPPQGTPNYFISTWEYVNALTVYKFHVDWSNTSLSSFTGPDISATGSSWPNQSVGSAATPATALDTLGLRAMARNHYTNIGGVESLWAVHTVRRATNGFATPRWYQVNVTGITVSASTAQTASWDPDGANVNYRYVPSLAVDRLGNLAVGYTRSNSTTNPAIMYAGRLATDPVNTFSQTEQVLFQGTGAQSCSSGCSRWGDYTSMSLDPADGCTFWYTNEYYTVNGVDDLTRIGAFKYPQCTPTGNGGSVSGQVTDSATANPIGGAVVMLGSGRSTTSDLSGNYSFTEIPSGTYPSITASASGYDSATKNGVVITDSSTTIANFVLNAAATPTPTPTPTSTPTPTPPPTPTPTPIPTIQVTVQTNPSGLNFTVDGNSYTSTQAFSWQEGSTHTIGTVSPQSGSSGVQYVWSSWTAGGAISHTVAPTKNTTYTAKFITQYSLKMNAGAGGTVTPASGWKNSGVAVSITATPTNNAQVSYNFSGWSGSGPGSYSGTTNPASITMSGPVTETAEFTQNPVQVTVQTNPTSLTFTVDGTAYIAAQTFSWIPRSSHTIATSSPQSGDPGVRYLWNTWSDSGAVSHSIAPTTNKIYTAKFATQYYLTMSSGLGGTLSPSSGWKNSGAAVPITAKPSTNYSFTSWSGTGAGSFSGATNPASITMSGPISETATFTHN